MSYNDTGFMTMLKNYGVVRIICSVDFFIPLILAILLTIIVYHYNIASSLLPDLATTYDTIATGMIAIIIAALAILVSMADDNFIVLLKKIKVYDNILFTFWYSSILAGISIAIDTGTAILTKVTLTHSIVNLTLVFLTTFLTSYSVIAVILAIGAVMRYGLYRAEFASLKYKK